MSSTSNIITIEMSTFGTKNSNANSGSPFRMSHLVELSSAILNAVYYHRSQNTDKITQLMLLPENKAEASDFQVSGSDSDPEAD